MWEYQQFIGLPSRDESFLPTCTVRNFPVEELVTRGIFGYLPDWLFHLAIYSKACQVQEDITTL